MGLTPEDAEAMQLAMEEDLDETQLTASGLDLPNPSDFSDTNSNPATLDKAIELAKMSSQMIVATMNFPKCHPLVWGQRRHLFKLLYRKYDMLSDLVVLTEAIDLGYEIMFEIPMQYRELASLCDDIGSYLTSRFEHAHWPEDLDAAINFHRLALGLISKHTVNSQAIEFMVHLGYCLSSRVNILSRLEDLDEAIYLSRKVLSQPDQNPSLESQELSNLAARLSVRYKLTGQSEAADEALKISQTLIKKSSSTDPVRGTILNNIVVVVGARYDKTRFQRDLEEAIRVARIAVLSLPTVSNHRAGVLRSLRKWLYIKYEKTTDTSVLQDCVKTAEAVLEATIFETAETFQDISKLGETAKSLFEKTNSNDDLKRAIDAFQRAFDMSMPTAGHEIGSPLALQLADLHATKFLRTQNLIDWTFALTHFANALVAPKEEQLPEPLKNDKFRADIAMRVITQAKRLMLATNEDKEALMLGRVVLEMYGKNSDRLGFIAAMTNVFTGVVQVPVYVGLDTQEETKAFCEKLNSYGLGDLFQLRIRFDIPKDSVHSSGATQGLHDTIEDTLAPERVSLEKISLRLRDKGGATDDPGTLQRLIEEATTALESYSDRDLGYVHLMETVAKLYENQYYLSRELSSIEGVLMYYELLVAITDGREGNLSRYKERIARFLQIKAKGTGSEEDLEQAIVATENALAFISDSSPDRPNAEFALALTLKAKYLARGEATDLERCVDVAKAAMRKFTKREAFQHSINFALIMRTSFQYTGNTKDLDKGVQTLAGVVERAREVQPLARVAAQSNLGLMLSDRYELNKDSSDLTNAIDMLRFALEGCEDGPVNIRLGILVNLASNLATAYDVWNDMESLEEAALLSVEAIDLTPIDSASRPQVVNDCSTVLLSMLRAGRGNIEIANLAIDSLMEAKAVIAPNSPLWVAVLVNIGNALSERLKIRHSYEDIQLRIQIYKLGWECEVAPVSHRIRSAWEAAKHLWADNLHIEAANILEQATRLLPSLSKSTIGKKSVQKSLSQFSGLVGDAALTSLSVERSPEVAVQILEIGRNIILGTTLDYRSEIASDEDEVYLEFVRQLNHFRMKEDIATTAIDAATSEIEMESSIKERRLAQIETTRLLKEIRDLPGHEGFLAPQCLRDWTRLASHGPIVLVFSSDLVGRGHAIVILPDRILSVALPGLTQREAVQRMQDMSKRTCRGSPSTFGERNSRMCDHLSWLWIVAVEPILSSLDLLHPEPLIHLPRIHWIGCGPFANAPFHAAGYHTDHSTNHTMSKCISSYAPTLRLLTFARSRPPKQYLSRKQDTRLLTVTMPTSPRGKGAPLPSALPEARTIQQLASEHSIVTTSLEYPVVSMVVNELPINNIVHFSCHGVLDAQNPSNSHLVLQDGDLSVSSIAKSHAAEADLAYLSACSTANYNDSSLADEAIHLVSSFQVAGFRNVVGSLWDTVDWACEEVSREFYKGLLKNEDGDDRETSEEHAWEFESALHSAVGILRSDNADLPLIWAPFVHWGG